MTRHWLEVYDVLTSTVFSPWFPEVTNCHIIYIYNWTISFLLYVVTSFTICNDLSHTGDRPLYCRVLPRRASSNCRMSPRLVRCFNGETQTKYFSWRSILPQRNSRFWDSYSVHKAYRREFHKQNGTHLHKSGHKGKMGHGLGTTSVWSHPCACPNQTDKYNVTEVDTCPYRSMFVDSNLARHMIVMTEPILPVLAWI